MVIPDREASSAATYTTNVSESASSTVLANFFLSISSTHLVVGRASAAV